METKPTNIADSAIPDIFKAGQKSAEMQNIKGGIVLHHKDFNTSDVSGLLIKESKRIEPSPPNPCGTIDVHRPESFPKVYEDHKEARTAVFADAERRDVVAIFDFLEPQSGANEPEAGWGQLRAVMEFRDSRKLKEWKQLREWSSQEAFANFLEDHLEDIVSPDGQVLLDLATDLEANKDGHFKGKMNLDNGSVKLSYQEEVQTEVEVPRRLTLGIPLFEHGDRFKLEVRLRFRVTSGGVRFKILFMNLEDTIDSHFEDIVQGLEEKIDTSIIRGRITTNY